MVYKYDPELKGTFRRRLILYYGLFIVVTAIIAFGVPLLILGREGFRSAGTFWPSVIFLLFLLAVFVLASRNSLRRYDIAELELTDEFIEFRLPGTKLCYRIPLGSITYIIQLPTIVDRKRLRIGGKGMKFLNVSSYLRGFDELRERLLQAKPGISVSSGMPYKAGWHFVSIAETLLIVAGVIFCKPLLFVGLSLLMLRLAFQGIVSYRNAPTKKTRVIAASYFPFLLLCIVFLMFASRWTPLETISFRKVPGELRFRVWITDQLYKYDKDGNCIYHKNFDRDDPEEYRCRFDAEGRMTYYRDLVENYEVWYDYDSGTGLLSHEKYSDGEESWYEYDGKSGLLLHRRYSDGDEAWWEYNEEGKETRYRRLNGFERQTSYEGNVETSTNTKLVTICTEYDDMRNIVHYRKTEKEQTTYEYWSEYDGKDETHTRYSDGREVWYQYDSDGRLLHERWLDGEEIRYAYDKRGNTICRISAQINPDTGESESTVESWNYNEHDDVTSYEQLGSDVIVLYDYKYDKAGRILKSYFTAERKETLSGASGQS
ncbi:MAG: RHS repeat protein [Treponema sp.]|nr:RHS repeat protein [Treponema sp.]